MPALSRPTATVVSRTTPRDLQVAGLAVHHVGCAPGPRPAARSRDARKFHHS